ncbi:OmpA family protein [Flammeovirgaceae bacterium SG7u.111]|nr:OmpA family protein [Flammeovirgaceae bacterium SG7u.132]WPO34028.1 OmpA family protein [Flammeovirgaceae bacterium SG7u.111]
MKNIISLIAIGLTSIFIYSSCSSWSNTAKGGSVGAGAGGAIGGVLGNKSGNTTQGAILGAAIGGVTGAAIGRYMDKQKEDLEEELGEVAEVERVGEGIKVTFGSGILFDFDSDGLKPTAKSSIQKMVETLEEYPDTEIMVTGHTDSEGSEKYNLRLSEERAKAVVEYAKLLGLNSDRLIPLGLGETQPVAKNDSEIGRAQNRRVEIAIYANEELKQKVKDGEVGK